MAKDAESFIQQVSIEVRPVFVVAGDTFTLKITCNIFGLALVNDFPAAH
jgi:hypothetical protein